MEKEKNEKEKKKAVDMKVIAGNPHPSAYLFIAEGHKL